MGRARIRGLDRGPDRDAPLAQAGGATPKSRRAPIIGFLGLTFVGLAYLAASTVGRPYTTAFWLVFFAVMAIMGPVVLLATRLR